MQYVSLITFAGLQLKNYPIPHFMEYLHNQIMNKIRSN